MNKLMRNTTWTTFGMMLALLTGAPAIADDTELLLVDPNNQTPKPNILMIIDSSGSMTTQEQTQLPYNAAEIYAGTCNRNMLYWTEVDAVPSCDAAKWRRPMPCSGAREFPCAPSWDSRWERRRQR